MAREALPRRHVTEPDPARMMGAAAQDGRFRLAEPAEIVAAAAEPNPLVVDVADVAARLGLNTTALTDTQVAVITAAILDAQGDVAGMLNRPVVPTIHVLARVYPAFGHDLGQASAWQHLERLYDDDIKVLSYVDLGDGTYEVEVQVGLDGRAEPAITRYIRAHAVELVRLDPTTTIGSRAVSSVSAEGQSISYEQRSQAVGSAGALPTEASIRQFKRHGGYQRQEPGPRRPWPYSR